MRDGTKTSLARALFRQVAGVAIFLLIFAYAIGLYLERNVSDHQMRHRVWKYQANAAAYDLLLIGDSRTYCGIHPEYIDPLLGTRSLNLATFTHWFPTQYAMVRELGESMRGKRVLWTIGHQNFQPFKIQMAYPVTADVAVDLVEMGVKPAGLLDVVLRSHTSLLVFSERDWLRRRLEARLGIPAPSAAKSRRTSASSPAETPKYAPALSRDQLKAAETEAWKKFGRDPTVASIETLLNGDDPTSVVLFRKGGGYERVELDPDYFRWQQRQVTPKRMSNEEAARFEFTADAGQLVLFDRLLEEYRKHGVLLTVNEVEEAGFMYPHPLVREKTRKYMRDVIQPRVEAAGFRYVRADLDRLNDDDFFDYNHLNSQGIAKYAVMLSDVLRPVLKRDL